MTVAVTKAAVPHTAGARRRDLDPLVEGRGLYTDDVLPPGTLHLAFVRSQHAHARIRRLETAPALDIPGVIAVFGPVDARGLPELPILSVVPGQKQVSFPVLADRARYVGQPLAAVVAESRYAAEDGVEAVLVEYDPLPAVVDVDAALQPDAPLLYPSWGDNVAARLVLEVGDPDLALATADLVIEETFRTPRQAALPLETRAIVADYDRAAELLTVWYSTQAPEPFRTYLTAATGLPADRIRIIAPRLGGGFGLKLHYHPEDVIACVLAVRLRRPVKYVEDRREHLLAAVHSREQVIRVRAGARRDGTLLALKAEILADVGAHLHTKGNAPAWLTARMLPGPYRVAHYRVDCRAVVTNKTPQGAYRGFGQPEAVFVHERLLEIVAARLGLDSAEVRRRNLIRPEEMPFRSAGGLTYDSGDLPGLLEMALAEADYPGLQRRRAQARAEGRLYGVGLACLIEYTAMGPSRLMALAGNRQGGYEMAVVRIFPSGDIACYTGLIELGQGTTWALARLCARQLGVPADQVRVYSGDTHIVPYSPYGTAASRGIVLAGGAVLLAAQRVREKVLRLGAHLLGVPLEEVELVDGSVRVRIGHPALTLREIAEEAWRGHRLPPGMEPGLEAKAIYEPENWTFSGQVHVVSCEVDAVTGLVVIHRYVVAHDCGRVVDAQLVQGQVLGGVAQGLGGALLEELRYDEDGQPLATTLLDYVVPGVGEMPEVRTVHLETPSPHTPGGMKGMAEGPLVGANAAVLNAVLDALGPAGDQLQTYPLTPARIIEALWSQGWAVEGRMAPPA